MQKRRADEIAENLEELIFSGGFSDGDRLDEIRLAQSFNVSRTPLREAFQRLATSGLVELIPRRGAFVRQPGPVKLIEMFEVMAELEAVCGRFAAMRITDEAILTLEEANRACQQAIDDKNPDGYYAENERFHHLIYKQSGNSFLEQEALKLHKNLKPYRRQQLRLRGRMQQSMAEHEAIVDALRNGCPDQAANALRSHVAVQGEKFHSLMKSLKAAAE
ncbi:GntR family transcriptional regulator [Halocynthiibacter styelae]|uniref:GntR family transcriptional regulator n=1 Tax=Halocynthiibacter styelae TaxID=2761955 RepID=A0A8J7LKR9_9RHOB|nr:GntR family transcriptional regulator [Paenihalocynthiibacter styelae]MBI1493194.1 GntR family transcriptional regulator [Paenihalocynthiibacter styelae]